MNVTPHCSKGSQRTLDGASGPLPVPVAGCALLLAFLCALFSVSASAQTHKVAPPQNVVRAVAVYEWTGDMAKPTASRLIPVSLFIDGKLRDAAVYLARPVPFALDTGNVYEIERAGIALGTLNVAFARHLVEPEDATADYDDGWFGYGKFFPPVPPKKSTLKPSGKLVAINSLDEDDDSPHFSARSATPGSGETAETAPGTSTTTNTPADNPDRPTLHRSASSPSAPDSSGSTPSDDPDRPTLRRHTTAEANKASAGQPDASYDDPALNNDPNRPLLHRGKPLGELADADIPKLSGLPGDRDLHQAVAVSDAVNRPPHNFSRAWDDDAQRQAILATMQAEARRLLAAYEAANAAAPVAANAAAPSVAAAPSKTPGRNNRLTRTTVQQTPPLPEPLLDEQLQGYTLSYGGPASYAYSAHTGGLGPTPCYVTLVAQDDMEGKPEFAIRSVTDAAHLNRAPLMRLVDAVDAEASNRASLLFELRAQNSRQFALYRVIGAQAVQTYLSGSTQ